jgi:hypothetical protein
MTKSMLDSIRKGRSMGQTVRGPLNVPRRFASHLGALGNEFRRHYVCLLEQWGPFRTELVRQAAADACQAHCVKVQAVRAWEEASRKRTTGRGRRPNVSEIIRLQKRIALESGTYLQSVNRLQDLLGTAKRPPTLADVVARRQGSA